METMAGSLKIRGAHPNESSVVVSYLRALHNEVKVYGGKVRSGPKTDEWLEYLFERAVTGEGICLVCADNGGIAGVSLAIEEDLPYDSDFVNPIFGFGTYVSPPYRKRGIAKELYVAMLREATARGNTYLGAYLVENKAIQSVLKSIGVIELETMILFPRE
jgi:GNAT superfamily N-acetyltransferase